jgi:gluconate 2-dehydrogenase gamma chain
MASQGPSRRQLLQAIACASLASTAPGFSRWAYGFAEADPQHPHHATTPHAPAKAAYKPRFFSPAEYATIGVLAELILPRTSSNTVLAGHHSISAASHKTLPRPEDAGATDAGVDEFIDFMVSEHAVLQPTFRNGLVWLDQASGSAQHFTSLPPADQKSLLDRLAYKSKFRAEEKIGQTFFALMRTYTVMGFYTSRIGIESLDYPGLRFYATSPVAPSDGSLQPMGA